MSIKFIKPMKLETFTLKIDPQDRDLIVSGLKLQKAEYLKDYDEFRKEKLFKQLADSSLFWATAVDQLINKIYSLKLDR